VVEEPEDDVLVQKFLVAVVVMALLALTLRWVAVLFLEHPTHGDPVWWPLAGAGPMALLLCRRRLWGAIVLGLGAGLAVAAATAGFSAQSVAGGVAGTTELVVTAALMARFWPERRPLGRGWQTIRLLACALTGTGAGSVAFALINALGVAELPESWSGFTRSHLLGLCVLSPALLTPQIRRSGELLAGLRQHRVNLEWALQLLVLGAVVSAVFLTHQRLISSSIIVLPLVWSCLRLGPLRTAIGQVLVAVVMTIGTNHGLGRVAALDQPHDVMLALQDSILNLTLVSLVVAVVAQIRDRALAVIHDRTRDLNDAERMAGLGSCRWEPGGQGVFWSGGMHTLLGTTPEDTTPGPPALLAALHPDDRERVYQQLVKIGQDGQRSTSEYRIVRRDGEVRDVISYAAAEVTGSGRVRQIIATLQDVTEAKAAAAAVSRAHDELAAVLDAVTGAAIIGADPATGVIQFFNRGAENLFGYSADEVAGHYRVAQLHDPDEVAELAREGITLQEEIAKSVASHGLQGRQWNFLRRDESQFPGQLNVSAQIGADGSPQALIGVVTDLSTVLQVRSELNESEDRFRVAFEGAPVGMAMGGLAAADPGRIFGVNPAFCELTGRSEEQLLRMRLGELIQDDEGAEESRRNVAELLAGALDVISTERQILRPDGREQWGRVSTSAVRPEGRDPYLIVLVEDITARKALTERLRHEATHDPLTGLPNRLHLNRQLEQALSGRRSDAVAVLYLDLDGFKRVNDTQGHSAGDELLIQVADRIAASVRASDVVARLGGDEFAVLCPGVRDEEIALRIGHAILAELSQEFDLGKNRARVGVSIGVAMGGEGDTGPGLLHAADQAMYSAKRAGKGTVQLSARSPR
jgi:diguanylate cyclase (GGDEF)-like protein/PAS domain S-box-containing protein